MKKVGDHVIFVDPVGIEHDALITAVWGEFTLNLVYVSLDPKEHDDYGNQIERAASIVNRSKQEAPGCYWKEHGAYA